MSTFAYKALDASGVADHRPDRGRQQGRRRRRRCATRASPSSTSTRSSRASGSIRDRRPRQAEGPHRLLAPVRDHGQLRPVHAALPLRARGADAQQEAGQGHRRGPRRRRGRHRLSDALEKHPKVFSRLYVSMVRAGELGGILDEVLNRLATQLEKEDSIRRAVKSAMVYPILIGSFAIIVLIGMVHVPHPDLRRHVQGSRQRQAAGCSRASWSAISDCHAQLVRADRACRPSSSSSGACASSSSTDRGHAAWDRFKLRIPMGIGEIIRKLAVARFSRTLGTLITSGVPILQAIEITGKAAGNVVIETRHGRACSRASRRGSRSPGRSRRSRCSRPWSRR